MEPGNAPLLARFARMVAESPHNLVSRAARAELDSRHVPEAVAFAKALPGPGRLLDIGSGGGLPGIVIAVVRPDLEVHLLEATGKKAAFLERAAEDLGISTTVHHGRAEDLAVPPLRGSFDLVTARAVASLERLVALAAPFLAPGGSLHALKGDRWPDELAAAGPAIRRANLTVTATPAADRAGEAVTGANRDRLEQTTHAPRVVVLTRA